MDRRRIILWGMGVILSISSQLCAGVYSGGSGTAEDSYKISTVADWQELTATSADWDKHFILLNDIDFGGVTLMPVAPDTDPLDWDFQGLPFTGIIDGTGHVLRNFVMHLPDIGFVGLFGYVGSGGQISNFGAESFTIMGCYCVGGLFGVNSGTINRCYTTGTVYTCSVYYSGSVGGLCGENTGTISQSYAIVNVSQASHYAGGLCGINSGTISESYAAGRVSAEYFAGGLCGNNEGFIDKSYANMELIRSINNYTGGLCGSNSGTVSESYATGSVYGDGGISGGLCGANGGSISRSFATGAVTSGGYHNGGLCGDNGGTISECFASGDVTTGGERVGGLCGSNSNTINQSFATGRVSGTVFVGGLCGFNAHGTISQSYSTGTVMAICDSCEYIGGLCGYNGIGGIILQSYSSGVVSGGNHSLYVGGLCGINFESEAVWASFWDTETSGQTGSSGGKGLSTFQMKTMLYYQNAGWSGIGWVMKDGQDYPHLNWENVGGESIPVALPIPLTGNGTPENPYQIQSPEDFALLSCYAAVLDRHIVLEQDLDMEGVMLFPIGELGPFTGTFDGKSHLILNASIHNVGSDFVGLFGNLGAGGEIRNIIAESLAVSGRCFVGGLCGYNSAGSIHHVRINSVVTGSDDYVGGLCGFNYKGEINQSCTTGLVSGNDYVGGLCGVHSCYGGTITISQCYSTSMVTGNSYVGGLCGGGCSGTIVQTYAAGIVSGDGSYVGGLCGSGSTSNVPGFWDIEATGQTWSACGVGKSTTEMQAISTFTAVGWDFGKTWGMPDGDYPRLFWEVVGYGYGSIQVNILPAEAVAEGAQWRRIGTTDWFDSGQIETLIPAVIWIIEFKPTTYWKTPRPISVSVHQNQLSQVEVFYAYHYSGGFGTENDPYQISTVADWQELIATSDDWGKYFLLTTDLDFQGQLLTPVGDSTISFAGVFNGNGHIVRNAVVNQSKRDFLGLFGCVGTSGQVCNLGMSECSITGKSRTGGLVGRNEGVVTACYVSGSVTGQSDVGGLVGRNLGTINSCYANCTVTGSGNSSGGLVGQVEDGTVSGCYATGAVTGAGDEIGGLIGYSERSTIEDCYSTGTLTFGTNSLYTGGLIGRNTGPVNRCFWDIETSGQTASEGGKGLTTSQMKSITLFQQFGWAGKGWIINDGVDYPHLVWEGTTGVVIPESGMIPLGGSGTNEDPYLINTAADFVVLSWHWSVLDKHIRLMDNLDLQGMQLDPIGDIGAFVGVFEGSGHILRNAAVCQSGSKYVGVFGRIGEGGRIYDVGVENVYAEGGYCVGGLAGDNDGSIENCHATGTVKGQDNVGGLVGDIDKGVISRCHSTVTVNGIEDTGGLVGQMNGGSVSQCYATGSVSGEETVGGLVGVMAGGSSVSQCYAAGSVSGGGEEETGGLVGGNYGTITFCYATGAVSGTYDVGGLVGQNSGTTTSCYATGNVSCIGSVIGGLVGFNTSNGTILACHSSGVVSGIGESVGGLAGDNNGTILNCYSSATVQGIGKYIGGFMGVNHYIVSTSYASGAVYGIGDYVGGFCGVNNTFAGITNSFWDTDMSGMTTSAGGEGKTMTELKTLSTFINPGWDFTNEITNGTNDCWRMCADGVDYPRLNWESIEGDFACPDGVSTEDFDYFVGRWLMNNCTADNHYCGGGDADRSGVVDLADYAILAQHWLEGV